MKLRKATRKRIREAAAKHESITISWPQSAPAAIPGHKYPVKGFDGETRLVVEKRKEVGGKIKVVVRLDHDPIRLLFGLSGQRNETGDYEAEPEPVSRPYQQRLDLEGRLKTTLCGARQRQMAKVLANEQKAADDRKRGKPGTLAQAAAERQQKYVR